MKGESFFPSTRKRFEYFDDDKRTDGKLFLVFFFFRRRNELGFTPRRKWEGEHVAGMKKKI